MSAVEVSDELLSEVKNFLDITWEDQETDAKLMGQIRRGIAYITEKTGVEASVFSGESVDDRAQELLFNYLLYARAGAIDQFVQNYSYELNSLRRRTLVMARNEGAEAHEQET